MTILNELVGVPLHRFTTQTLEQLRTDAKCEGLYFEFKSIWKPDDVSRCVCAFANAGGGYLLIGVSQTSDGCIDSMPGLDPGPEYPLLAKDRIVGHISPLPNWDAVSVASPDDSSRAVLVVRIEESGRPPHVLTGSGQIYIRTPTACDPVRDRGTIDALFAKARDGVAAAEARASTLSALATDRDPADDEWTVTITAVPDPYAGEEVYRALIEPAWRERASQLFEPEIRVRPMRLLEDGVLLVGPAGLELVVTTDGAVRARWILARGGLLNPLDRDVVPASWIGGLIEDVLRAQSRLEPPVRQSRATVLLGFVEGMRVVEGSPGRINVPSPSGLPMFWERTITTLTEHPHSQSTSEMLLRRLWRAAGAEHPEPE